MWWKASRTTMNLAYMQRVEKMPIHSIRLKSIRRFCFDIIILSFLLYCMPEKIETQTVWRIFALCFFFSSSPSCHVIRVVSPLSLLVLLSMRWLSLGPDQSDCVILYLLYKIYSHSNTRERASTRSNRIYLPRLAEINWMA